MATLRTAIRKKEGTELGPFDSVSEQKKGKEPAIKVQTRENSISKGVTRTEIQKLLSTIGNAAQTDFDSLSTLYLRDLSALYKTLGEKFKQSKAFY